MLQTEYGFPIAAVAFSGLTPGQDWRPSMAQIPGQRNWASEYKFTLPPCV